MPIEAPLPANESQRLKALDSYAILDTPHEENFDRITRLVSRILKVPIATVTLVDKDRQWFKASCGMEDRETPRNIAFCAHAILSDEMMIVPDATRDPRFADNPLVTGPHGIRFYAGMPLKAFDGTNIGVLCAIDRVPRKFNAEQKELLKELAQITTAELRLRRETLEKNRLATAIAHVATQIVVIDCHQPHHPIIFCNPAFSKITGYPPEEVLGEPIGVLMGEKTDPSACHEMRAAMAKRKPYQTTLLHYRKTGEPFWNDIHITPVFDENGQLQNYVGIGYDVTERKKSLDELRANYERLQEMETLRDNLTHMIIHDLRAPLSFIMGFLEIVEQTARERLNETEMDALLSAHDGTRQLNDMVTSLLDISRLESGKMPITLTNADLNRVIHDALKKQVALLGASRLILEFGEIPIPIRCDTGVTARVVTNLVGNALKFSPEKTAVKVRVTLKRGQALVSVTDSGPGIAKEAHAMIFEKFAQVAGMRQLHSSGLGLTFCKLAVEAQGGKIGLESAPGHGSTFWFTLPLANPCDPPPLGELWKP
ncbi:MAG: ATP-binding protein [Chthoniobacteraceae bacterium]